MDRLGKYEIRGILGRGAMGTVYEAWDPHIARRVAVKTVRLPDSSDSEERELLERFKQEAQAAGRLQHPNIVGVFDYAETDELAYIVMEFVEGRTLKALLDEEPRPSLERVGQIMAGLLAGLAYSHSHQVIHRDIKPANVIMTPAGVVKIADFGIARIGGSGMTVAGTIMGTPAYMSPEQFKGTGVDARTDIYSAGVLLFQMLTGKRPFEGNMATIMQAVLNEPVPRPSDVQTRVPPALDAVVARAMGRTPDDRYADALAFERSLQGALQAAPALPPGLGDLVDDEDATVVRPTRAAAPAPAVKAKSRMPLVAAGAVVALLVAGGGGYALFGGGKPGPVDKPVQVATTTGPGGTTTGQSTDTKPADPKPADTGSAAGAVKPDNGTAASVKPTEPAGSGTRPAEPPVQVTGTTQTTRPVDPQTQATKPADPAVQATKPVDTTAQSTKPVETATLNSKPAEPPPPIKPPEPAAQDSGGTLSTASSSEPPATHDLRPPVPPAFPVAAVAAAVGQVVCSATFADESPPGTIRIRGIATASGDRALHDAVHTAALAAPVDWEVALATGPYCGVLDTMRPRMTGDDGVSIILDDGRTALVKDQLVIPRVSLPPSSAYLQLDYISNDGGVVHISQAVPGTPYQPGATAVFGRATDKGETYPVDQPYGTDMLIAVASSAPLFTAPRKQIESLSSYMRDLRAALDRAGGNGTRLSANVLLLRTSAR